MSSEGQGSPSAVASDAERKADQALREVNKVTDILCRLLRNVTPEDFAKLDPDIQQWFAAHSRFDRRQGR